MSYAIPSDLLARYDVNTVGDLVNDNNQRQTPTQLATNVNLLTALSNAAGVINSAALFSERYTVAQLQALTGDDLAFLVGINCDIAMGRLALRRSNDPAKFPAYVEAMELLEHLRTGHNIFNVPGIQGVTASEFPSFTTYSQVNLLRDACLNRYFPIRRFQNQAVGGQSIPTNQ